MVVPEGHHFMMEITEIRVTIHVFGGLSQTKTSSAELLRFGCTRIQTIYADFLHNPLDPLSPLCPDTKSKQHLIITSIGERRILWRLLGIGRLITVSIGLKFGSVYLITMARAQIEELQSTRSRGDCGGGQAATG